MRTIFNLFLVMVAFAVLPLLAFTTDSDADKILNGKYFKSSYLVPYLETPEVVPDGAQVGLLIRAEPSWNGGYVKINMMFAGRAGQYLNALVYSGLRMGCTNSPALTNYWVRPATSNLGGIFVGTNGTTTYTIATCTNTNTNFNNANVQCLYNAKTNRVLYTTIGLTNNNTGDSLAVVKMANNTSPAGIMTLGTLVDTYRYVNSALHVWGSTPTYYLPSDTYMLVVFTNTCPALTTNHITNLYIDVEFTRK